VTRYVPGQEGFSLVELLIAMTIMLGILGATLTSFDGFITRQRQDERRSEAQDSLRRGMDHLQRQLRNLATPAANQKSINRALGTDLIFQTADPLKRWVRYCVDPSDPLAASGRASLWYQISDTALMPAASACPEPAGWASRSSVGEAVVNFRNGLVRPVFMPNWPKNTNGTDNTSDTSAITRMQTELWVDTNPGASPTEQRLASGVFLRNQNQVPVPRFTWAPGGHVLNASATSDPEGRRLNYHWYRGAAPPVPAGCEPGSTVPSSYLGSGVVLSVPAPVATTELVTLCVVDPGGLTATISKSVTFS